MIKFTKVEHKAYERWITRRITLREVRPTARVTLTIPASKSLEYQENKELYVALLTDHLTEGKALPLDFPRIVGIDVDIIDLN